MNKENKGKRKLCPLSRLLTVGAVIVVLCLGITSCAPKPPQITIEQMIEANRTETLLNNYTSIQLISTVDEIYFESDLCYIKYDMGGEIITPDNAYRYYDGQYQGLVRVGGKWAKVKELYSHLAFNATSTEAEIIEKVETDKDTITLHTTLSSKDYGAVMDILGYPYEEGDYSKSVYKMDAKTLAILEFQDVIYHADGTSENGTGGTLTYHAPRPENADLLLARLSNPQDLRTITVIADPGTDQEQISSASAPKGEAIGFELDTEDEWEIYSDAECTQVYPGGASKDLDLTLYCKKK